MEIKVYLVLATILSLVGIFEGVISFRKENKTGKYLGAACFLAVLCTLSFLISALADTKTQIALSSSLYFIFIDFTVFFLVCFIFNYCSYSQNWKVKTFVIVCLVGLVYEVVIFTINIFKPIAIDYIFDLEAEYAKYSYDMKPLFFVHLGFTYVMLVYIVIMLLIRMISVPKHYKSQYLNIVFMLAVIVGVNAVFLYNDSLRLDYSVLLYIIAAVFCYWATFWYTKHNMLNRFKSVVVDTVDLGVVLFDYKDNFLMANKSAEKLLENIKLNEKLSVNSFTEFLGLYLNESFDKSTSICYVKRSDGLLSLRCEYSRFVDNKGKSEGRLFILTSEALELD